MNSFNLIWVKADDGKLSIKAENSQIKSNISIDTESNQIDGVRAFFQEVVYLYYIEDLNCDIKLIEDIQIEIKEVRALIDEIILTINTELRKATN